ncbi:hypothetical protein [Burkholderia plantarii]|uniref:hypothetical protein n=1 Tax=Burkholderia plantarii TaxID=41899 RepID=UPI0018DD202D|nr:hypothetical protein [Burkholderia plantarii]MBI0329082.1 hypothetical protein [Burkholderia plantarii]
MRKDKPFSPTLRLRGDAQRVEVIVPNGTTRPVLGTRDPGDDDRRAATIEHAGGAGRSPRQQPLASIELELPRRAQTILTQRLPREVRERLDGDGAGRHASARNGESGDTGSETLIVPEPGEGG